MHAVWPAALTEVVNHYRSLASEAEKQAQYAKERAQYVQNVYDHSVAVETWVNAQALEKRRAKYSLSLDRSSE